MPRDVGRHQCPIGGCHQLLPHTKLMCLSHWRSCPQRFRDAVNAAYDNGHGLGTEELAMAQDAAIQAVEAKLARKGSR